MWLLSCFWSIISGEFDRCGHNYRKKLRAGFGYYMLTIWSAICWWAVSNWEGQAAGWKGGQFFCGVNYGMDWAAGLKKREGSLPVITQQLTPPSLMASYSLFGNMRDALYGTTLIFCIHLIPSTKHPGFHLNRKMNSWNSKLSSLFNSNELI